MSEQNTSGVSLDEAKKLTQEVFFGETPMSLSDAQDKIAKILSFNPGIEDGREYWRSLGIDNFALRFQGMVSSSAAFDLLNTLETKDSTSDEAKKGITFALGMITNASRLCEDAAKGEAALWKDFTKAIGRTAYLELAQSNFARGDVRSAAAYLRYALKPV